MRVVVEIPQVRKSLEVRSTALVGHHPHDTHLSSDGFWMLCESEWKSQIHSDELLRLAQVASLAVWGSFRLATARPPPRSHAHAPAFDGSVSVFASVIVTVACHRRAGSSSLHHVRTPCRTDTAVASGTSHQQASATPRRTRARLAVEQKSYTARNRTSPRPGLRSRRHRRLRRHLRPLPPSQPRV